MSRSYTQAWLATALLASASALAQEQQHEVTKDAPQDTHHHAMHKADEARDARSRTEQTDADEAAQTSANADPAMHMDHAHMQHMAQMESSNDVAPSANAAGAIPAQPPMQGDTATSHAATQQVDVQHGDMQHAAHASSQSPQTDHAHMSHADMEPGAMDHEAMQHESMGHGAMHHQAIDHASMDHAKMEHAHPSNAAQTSASPTNTAITHNPADAGDAGLPREPIPTPTAEDIAAAFAPLHPHTMHSADINHYVLLDRLEGSNTDRGSAQAWEARAWIGGDIDRIWLRSEGERHDGRTESASLEAFYGHAISPWWDLLVGARQDIGAGARRGWAAFGIQGLAPYKFETEATLYLGSGSRAALRLEGEYEVLLTNRLILQPRVEADIALTDHNSRGIGSGLEEVEVGLRLRYEITRRFAPYIGWVHSRSFGDTAKRAAIDNEPARDSRFVAGVRVWF